MKSASEFVGAQVIKVTEANWKAFLQNHEEGSFYADELVIQIGDQKYTVGGYYDGLIIEPILGAKEQAT